MNIDNTIIVIEIGMSVSVMATVANSSCPADNVTCYIVSYIHMGIY